MDKYSISVIVPVYNTEQYLRRSIDSLIKQTIPIQIVLVDDGSTDQSGYICDQYAKSNPNITVIHKQNGGSSSAKNAGIEASKTEYIGFVDSDDCVTEDMYEYLYQLQKQYQADVVQIEYITVTDESMTKIPSSKEHIICLETKEGILKRYLEDGMKPVKSYSTCTKLYKRNLFDDIRFPDKQAYDDVTTNYDLLSNANKYVISNRQCYFYYIREESITKGRFNKKDLDYIKAGEQIVARTASIPELKRLGNMTLARFHFTCLCKMLRYGCEPDIDYKSQIQTSIPIIRRGMMDLLKSGMRSDRKIIMMWLCMNIKLTTCFAKQRIV